MVPRSSSSSSSSISSSWLRYAVCYLVFHVCGRFALPSKTDGTDGRTDRQTDRPMGGRRHRWQSTINPSTDAGSKKREENPPHKISTTNWWTWTRRPPPHPSTARPRAHRLGHKTVEARCLSAVGRPRPDRRSLDPTREERGKQKQK